MSGLLMVPIHLDALVLVQDQVVASASANFSHLPYSDTTQDVNAAIANISEEIVSQPFDEQISISRPVFICTGLCLML